MVGAYKGLLKEKEALEASVNALSAAAHTAAAASTPSKESTHGSTFEDPLNVAGNTVNMFSSSFWYSLL